MRDGVLCVSDPPHRKSLLAPYDQAPSPAALSDVLVVVLSNGIDTGEVLGLFRLLLGAAKANDAGRCCCPCCATAASERTDSALGHAHRTPNTSTADCFITLASYVANDDQCSCVGCSLPFFVCDCGHPYPPPGWRVAAMTSCPKHGGYPPCFGHDVIAPASGGLIGLRHTPSPSVSKALTERSYY